MVLIRKPPDSALALALTEWATRDGGTWLHVAAGDALVTPLATAAAAFVADVDVIPLPAWDSLPYDRVQPSRTATAARVAGLFRLAQPAERPRLVITSAAAILQRVPPRGRLVERGVQLSPGTECDPAWLQTTLTAFGYRFEEQVSEPGEAAANGAVIDLFPGGAREPIRLETDSARLVSLRTFSPTDQRSIAEIDSLLLLPVSEAFTVPGEPTETITERLLPQGDPETLFDYLDAPSLSLEAEAAPGLDDSLAIIRDAYETRRVLGGAIEPPERMYLTREEIAPRLANPTIIFGADGEIFAEPVEGDPAPTPSALAVLLRRHAEGPHCRRDPGPATSCHAATAPPPARPACRPWLA